MTHLHDLQVKVIDFELSFYVSGKILTSLYFLSFYKDPVWYYACLLDIGLKFNALP